ncbi:MAG: DUF881 domain-containing protein [Clostridia bacterium]|nr:DUF881 domain-containing protein [Clostridia bacterium]
MKELIKTNGAKITIGIICFLLMFMITCQIRTISVSESEILRLKNENELRDEVNQWKDMYNLSIEKNNELRAKIEEYQNASSQSSSTVALIKKELDGANILAGLVDVKGEGIKITLDDTRAINQIALDAGGYDPNVFIIHDSDLLMIVNELIAAGAEAVSINGQRISTRTEIRCIGPVISINGARYSAPFVIAAIGDSDILESSMKLRGGVIDSLEQANIDVTIEKSNEIVIEKYNKTINNKYATPVE